MKRLSTVEPPVLEIEATKLPWLQTWHSVYLFVFGCFVLDVALLAVLAWAFS